MNLIITVDYLSQCECTVLLQKFRATLFIVVFFVKFLHGPQTLLKLPFAVIALLPTALRHDFLCYVSLC